MSNQKKTIAVDANPLVSSLRGGRARMVLLSAEFIFITTEQIIWEVKKYIPQLATQSGVSETELLFALDRFPIIAIPSVAYADKREQAEELIAWRDHKDVDILALALKFNAPLWSNDKDFQNIQELQLLTTADILEQSGLLAE